MTRPPRAPLTEAQVRRMRLRHSQGLASVRELAREHGLGAEAVRRILRWETWAWVGEEGPGAEASEWAPRQEDLAASQARLLALASGQPLGPDLAQQRQAQAIAQRAEASVEELAGHPNAAMIDSTIPAAVPTTDGEPDAPAT